MNRIHRTFAFATLVTLAAGSALAAPPNQTSDTLDLKGYAEPVTQIEITASAEAGVLPLLAGAQDLRVASLLARANVDYTLTFESEEKGVLAADESSNHDIVDYVLTYRGKAMDLEDDFTMPSAPPTTTDGLTSPVTITFPPSFVRSGSYRDTVTVTIAGS